MRARRFLAVLFPLAATACAAIANLDHWTLDPDAGSPAGAGAEDASPAPPPPPTTTGTAPTPPVDAGPPSYCAGITFYRAFDGDLGSGAAPSGGVTFAADGKYGGAVSLVRDAGSFPISQLGAAIDYGDGGAFWTADVGSVALWFRAAAQGAPNAPILFRPIAAGTPQRLAGLQLYLRDPAGPAPDRVGLETRTPVLVFNESAIKPYLLATDYNHYFGAWDRKGTTTAYLAINGGLGVIHAAGDPDAGPGVTPYRATTGAAWTAEGPPIALRIGGVDGNSPEGAIDDFVVWNRVVSFAELAAIYGAPQSVGATCNLR